MAVNVVTGFSLKAKMPIDERFVFETKQEMLDYDKNALYEGLVSYCKEEGKEYIFKEDDWQEYSAGGGSADSAVWESDEPTATALGGIKAGTNLKDKSALEILDMALNPYMSPVIAISITPNTTLYEVGQNPSITITANLTKKTEAITAAKILKDGANLKEASEGEITAKSFNQSGVQINTDTTFASKVSDAKGEVNGNSISVKFTRRSYYGLIDGGDSVDSGTKIEALAQNQLTGTKALTWANYNANNQKVVYAYPKSFGDLTSIKDGNNFETISSFDKTEVQRDGVAYNVYTLKAPMSITAGKLVFS